MGQNDSDLVGDALQAYFAFEMVYAQGGLVWQTDGGNCLNFGAGRCLLVWCGNGRWILHETGPFDFGPDYNAASGCVALMTWACCAGPRIAQADITRKAYGVRWAAFQIRRTTSWINRVCGCGQQARWAKDTAAGGANLCLCWGLDGANGVQVGGPCDALRFFTDTMQMR
jgi:farnesyl diphosphate synthase